MTTTELVLDDGRKIAYERLPGSEPGIVFLSGFGSDMAGTKATHLAATVSERGHAYLRFDYQGHGLSSGRFEDGTIGIWTADAIDAIEALTSGPQILVGSSMGGWIALLIAKRRPELVAGIVGIAAAPDFTEEYALERLDPDLRKQMERAGQIAIPSPYSSSPTIITRALVEDGKHQKIFGSRLNLPGATRLLHGTDDADVPPDTAMRLLAHATCDDMRTTFVKHADHMFSTPECLAIIDQAVDSVIDALVKCGSREGR